MSCTFLYGKRLHDIFHSKGFVETFIKDSFLFKKTEALQEKNSQTREIAFFYAMKFR